VSSNGGRKAQSGAVRPAVKPGEIWVVPVTRLYDRGTTMVSTPLLAARMARPEVWMHPVTAGGLGLAHNEMATLGLENCPSEVQVKVDETLPEGIALLPRSVGVPVSAPVAAKIERAGEAAAVDAASSRNV
jgi:anaerobic selenocysteine-containing dehydrogenase